VTRDAIVGASRADLLVRKEILLGGDRRSPTLTLGVTVTNRSGAAVEATLGLEWTLMLLGGGGNPAAWWDVGGTRTSHDSAGSAIGVTALSQGNDYVGISVATTISEPAEAWWAPVETISNSESGFERVYQGAGLLLSWPLSVAPGASRTVSVSHAVTTAHDRTAEELAAATTAAGATPSPES
jgi:4-alpha-glucanotransferase